MKPARVVIDMLNTYEHEDADLLQESAREIVPNLSRLVSRAQERGIVVVYVNDNYGNWTAGRRGIISSALSGPDPELIEPIVPATASSGGPAAGHIAPVPDAGHTPNERRNNRSALTLAVKRLSAMPIS